MSSASTLYLGYNAGSTGSFSLIGGAAGSGNLYLGYNAGSAGNYLLSGTASLTTENSEFIGYSGLANFNQTGGTNNSFGDSGNLFYLAYGTSSTATYSLSGGGALIADGGEFIGWAGTALFNQSGGTNTIGAGDSLTVSYVGATALTAMRGHAMGPPFFTQSRAG